MAWDTILAFSYSQRKTAEILLGIACVLANIWKENFHMEVEGITSRPACLVQKKGSDHQQDCEEQCNEYWPFKKIVQQKHSTWSAQSHNLTHSFPYIHNTISMISKFLCPEDEGSKFLWNLVTYLPTNIA